MNGVVGRIARIAGIPAAEDLVLLSCRKQGDVPDAHVEVRKHAVQYSEILIDEARDSALVEQVRYCIRRKCARERQIDCEPHLELRGLQVDRVYLSSQLIELHSVYRRVQKIEHDLGQRRATVVPIADKFFH